MVFSLGKIAWKGWAVSVYEFVHPAFSVFRESLPGVGELRPTFKVCWSLNLIFRWEFEIEGTKDLHTSKRNWMGLI